CAPPPGLSPACHSPALPCTPSSSPTMVSLATSLSVGVISLCWGKWVAEKLTGNTPNRSPDGPDGNSVEWSRAGGPAAGAASARNHELDGSIADWRGRLLLFPRLP